MNDPKKIGGIKELLIAVFLLLSCLFPSWAHAISWTAMPSLDEGQYVSVTVADFNNDGYNDVAGVSGSNIGAWQQSLRWVCPASLYSWSFNPVADIVPGIPSGATELKAVASGDIGSGPASAAGMKNDGYPDIVVATDSGIYLYYGNGMGTWNSTPPYAVSNVGYGKMGAVTTDNTTPTDSWTVALKTKRNVTNNLPQGSGGGSLNSINELKEGAINDGDSYIFTFSNSSSFSVTKSGSSRGSGKIGNSFTTSDSFLNLTSTNWSGSFTTLSSISLDFTVTPSTFSVTGSSTGALADATEGINYSSGGLSFLVEEDNLDYIVFDEGDQFTFSTYAIADNQISADTDVVTLDLIDIDNDGEVEIVAGTTNGIRVYDYSGAAWVTLDTGGDLPTTGKWKAVSKDLNHDGDLDLVGVSENGDVIKGWYSDGSGGWTETAFTNTTAVYYSLEVQDINGDGNYDIMAGVGDSGIEVWLGNSDGTYIGGTKLTGSDRYYDLKSADINNDGVPDLVGAQWGGGILVWLGDGEGDWIPETTPVETGDYRDLAIDEINNDGLPDIVGADNSAGVHVFLQAREVDADVGWASSDFPTASGDFQGTAAGDFNRDGNMDAVVAGNASGVRVFYGDGQSGVKATLSVFKSYSGTGDGTIEILATDDVSTITEDWTVTCVTGGADPVFEITRGSVGSPEAAQYSLPGTYTNSDTGVSFVIYPGSVDFAAGDVFTFKTVAGGITNSGVYYGVVTADFNNDGILDVAAASNGGNGIDIWYGNGEGEWDSVPPADGTWDGNASSENIGSGNYYYLAFGDVNQDGNLDIVAGSDSGVQVFTNDWDGTSTGWTNTPGNDPVSTGSYAGVALADFNNDGKLDIAAGNRGGNGVRVWTGKGDGSFRKLYATKPIRDRDLDGVEDSLDGSVNTGNGSISAVTIDDAASDLGEYTWWLVASGASDFDIYVYDPDDGTLLATDTYTIPATYSNATYGISFTITAGSVDFASGDSFSFRTYKDTGPIFDSSVIFPDGRIMTYYYDGIAVSDFDRDGNMDIVAGNLGNFGVQVFYGDGDMDDHGHITWSLSTVTPPVPDCLNAGDAYIQDLAASAHWSGYRGSYRWQGSFGKDAYIWGQKLKVGVTTSDYVTVTEDLTLTAHEPTTDEPWDYSVPDAENTGASLDEPFLDSPIGRFDFILRGSTVSYTEPTDKLYFSAYRT